MRSGFDSIILSARNEIKLAVINSATQDDFNYLKETLASKTDIEEVKNEVREKIKEMENKVSEFREDNDVSLSSEEESDEQLDDVMAINQKDPLLEENLESIDEEEFKRDKSWKSDGPKMGNLLY